ncbi:MAG: SRPBCC family protein, partial [Ferroplasma sp.]
MKFHKEIDINCEREKLWKLIINFDRVPEFWHGTRRIEPHGEYYEVQFAFPGKGKMYPIINNKDFTLQEVYRGGPFKGTKTAQISGSDILTLTSEWNIKLTTILVPFQFKLQQHFEKGTEEALERIKKYMEAS